MTTEKKILFHSIVGVNVETGKYVTTEDLPEPEYFTNYNHEELVEQIESLEKEISKLNKENKKIEEENISLKYQNKGLLRDILKIRRENKKLLELINEPLF